MSSYLALDDFAQYGIGTAASVAFGNIQGGAVFSNEGSFSHQEGAAGQDDIVWELSKPTAKVETIYKGESLLANCLRSVWNGMPPEISFLGGVLSTTASLAAQISSAYVNKLKVACGGVGEPVKVDYDLIGVDCVPTMASSSDVATITATDPFVWQEGAVTINGVGCRCQSFEINVENGLTHDSSLDAKAAGSQRVAECIDVGSEKVSASFEVRVPLGTLDFSDDTPTLPIDASVVISNGYTSKTITLRGLYLKPIETELLRGEDKHTWKIEGESRYNSLRSAATAAITIA